MISWDEIAARLGRERTYWLATIGADGAPHVSPVWGAVADGEWYAYSERNTVKARNLASDSRVAVQLSIGLNLTVNLPVIGAFHDIPLLVAFVVLAVYTYTSGLHGTAIISVAKGILVYVAVIAAVIVIPIELGGYDKIFASIPSPMLLLGHGTADNLGPSVSYASLAVGSLPLLVAMAVGGAFALWLRRWVTQVLATIAEQSHWRSRAFEAFVQDLMKKEMPLKHVFE